MQQSEARKAARLGLLALLILLVALTVPRMITDGKQVVSLKAGSAFGGQISQYLGIPTGQKDLAVEGKDFAINDTRFYNGDDWVLVHFKAMTKRVSEGGYVVFHRDNGVYTVAVGPATSFSSNYLEGTPQDMINYLRSQGAIYEPTL